VTDWAVFYTEKLLKIYAALHFKPDPLKSNYELVKVGMSSTKIMGILTEAADFLSLDLEVCTILPYGEWNTCFVYFTVFHRASFIGLE